MPRVQQVIEISAPAERVWETMIDVERWSAWSPPVRSIKREDSGAFRIGSRARNDLDGAPPSVWTVTALDEGRSFTWESTVRGVTSVASHDITPTDDGCRVTLTIESSGFMASLFGPMISRVYRRNTKLEAEGLKRYCESAVA